MDKSALLTMGGIFGRMMLQAAAGAAVAHGYIGHDDATTFITSGETIAGAILAAGSAAWSWNQKKRAAAGK